MTKVPAEEEVLDIAAVRAAFADSGMSIAEWARENGFSASLVYHLLAGRNRGVRGQSHRIAVALRLKRGSRDGRLRLGQIRPKVK